ncbi:MAG: DNA repair protein RecO [Bacillota bacterium]|nr:DNA repair protein RecO [Bacillota bacterium]
MYYSSKSVILKNRNLRESDQLVTIFSEKEGKLTAVARGTKKPKSSLRACTQPFCHSFLHLSRGRELDIITQGKIVNFFGNSREDITRTLYVMYMMELLDKSMMERVPSQTVYRTLIYVLETMDQTGYNPLLIRFFEMRLVVYLGYTPMLQHCVSCGQSSGNSTFFSLSEGGVLCTACREQEERNLIYLSGESISLLKLMISNKPIVIQRIKASPAALQQMEYFLEKYLEYHLERRFKMKNTIRLLKQRMSL